MSSFSWTMFTIVAYATGIYLVIFTTIFFVWAILAGIWHTVSKKVDSTTEGFLSNVREILKVSGAIVSSTLLVGSMCAGAWLGLWWIVNNL